MATQCRDCGSTEVEDDEQQGQIVCTGCGAVLQSYILLAQQQFQETSAGGVAAVGQHVGEGGPRGRGYGRESRAVTLDKGKKRIERMAAQLSLKPNLVAEAFNYFRQAVSRHMTQGRNSDHFAAACLYLACRLNANSEQGVMLLDFSDLLQADVYALGRVYMQLCSALHVSIPLLDPCLYIQRFALGLQFGDKTRKVEDTAMRLVQRMKKDWMHWGRRPTGLCGAALLVAARIYDFSRTIQDVVKVVRISEGTIKKRLMEFEKTESSKLTVDEFDTKRIDLEQEMDPPCYTEGLRKAKLAQLEEQGELTHLTEEVERLKKELEEVFQDASMKKNRRYKKFMASDSSSSSICSVAPSLSDLDDELAQYADLLGDVTKPKVLDDDDECSQNIQLGSECTDDPIPMDIVKQLDSILMPPPSACSNSDYGLRPTAASLGLKESIEECLKEAEYQADADENDGELDLTDINDEEIDKMILTEEEVKIKTTIWMRENAEYLKEMKEKEEQKAKELEEQPQPKKTRSVKRRKPKVEARSAGEAFEKMVQEKKLSRKINYDVLKDLDPAAFKTENRADSQPSSVQLVDDDTASPERKKPKLKVEGASTVSQNTAAADNADNVASLVPVDNDEEIDEDEEDFDEAESYHDDTEDRFNYHEHDEDYNVDVYEKY